MDSKKETAESTINQKLAMARALLWECTKLADENDLTFEFDLPFGTAQYSDGYWDPSDISC